MSVQTLTMQGFLGYMDGQEFRRKIMTPTRLVTLKYCFCIVITSKMELALPVGLAWIFHARSKSRVQQRGEPVDSARHDRELQWTMIALSGAQAAMRLGWPQLALSWAHCASKASLKAIVIPMKGLPG